MTIPQPDLNGVPNAIFQLHIKALTLLSDSEKFLKEGDYKKTKKLLGTDFLETVQCLTQYYSNRKNNVNLFSINAVADRGADIYSKAEEMIDC